MIMIVLGAGASYDSAPSKPPSMFGRDVLPQRLPLANEMFLDQGIFQRALARFPKCNPIVPYLQDPSGRTNVESVLERLQNESGTDVERTRQLAAVRYYLHFMIWECERAWNTVAAGVTNYTTLLDQVRRSLKPKETVALVTFNYDRMIEAALRTVDVNISSMGEYISHDTFKLYKLHGSVHWGRVVQQPAFSPEHMGAWDAVNLVIENANQLVLSNSYYILNEHPIAFLDKVLCAPAIAVPVRAKSTFECPESHLESLRNLLPSVTKMIVIGWKGADLHFLNMMKQLVKARLPVCVVAQNRRASQEVFAQFSEVGLLVAAKPTNGGFSEFVREREAESFLQSH